MRYDLEFFTLMVRRMGAIFVKDICGKARGTSTRPGPVLRRMG